MNIKLGKALSSIRKASNLSQQEVAKIINCSRGTYSCWERDEGEIPLSKLLQLLSAYDISLSTFIKKVQEENPFSTLSLHEIDSEKLMDVKAELKFISDRIKLINQNLIL